MTEKLGTFNFQLVNGTNRDCSEIIVVPCNPKQVGNLLGSVSHQAVVLIWELLISDAKSCIQQMFSKTFLAEAQQESDSTLHL